MCQLKIVQQELLFMVKQLPVQRNSTWRFKIVTFSKATVRHGVNNNNLSKPNIQSQPH